ncbi:unnamed protein product [Cochlearia groenlandica]
MWFFYILPITSNGASASMILLEHEFNRLFHRNFTNWSIPRQPQPPHHRAKSCPRLKQLKQAHAHLIVTGYGQSRSLLTKLSIVAWNSLVSGLEQNGFAEEAIRVFYQMRESGFEPDSATFVSLLSACAHTGAISLGRQIHCTTVKNGLLGFIALSNAIVTMYSKCESLVEAGKIFDSLGDKNAITWSAMVTGYSQNGESLEAVKLFSRMFSAGVKPSEYTIVGVLNACSDICYVEEGKQLHSLLLKLGFENHLFATTALVDMYAKAGCLADARKGFNCLKERDVALWTSVISGYVQNSDNEEALIMYCGMKSEGIVPNEPTMASVLKACASLATLELGKQMHGHTIKHGFSLEVPIGSALSTMYSKCGSLEDGSLVFQRTPNKDVVSWNAMISGLSHNGRGDEALELFEEMLAVSPSNYTFTSVIKSCADLSALRIGKGVQCHAVVSGFGLDTYVQASLVTFYSKCGDMRSARQVFDVMPVKSIVAWNSLVSGLEQNGFAEEAIRVFYQMRESGFEPDSATFVSLLSACAHTGAISLGSWVHRYIVQEGLGLNVKLGTALINLYSRCGDVEKAREVFDIMKETNVAAWTAMISAYGSHGHGKQAVDLFNKMDDGYGPIPNNVTFVAVLSACAHGGLVEEGRSVYKRMTESYGLIPGVEHHVCMIDMLGRAGFLEEAYRFIHQLDAMGKATPPALWTAMLGACKMHKNFDLGVEIAKRLIELEPENPGHHVMLSNIYALSGKTDEVSHIRDGMIKNNLRKQVGYSVIEVENKTYLFSMGDESHQETGEIYHYLETLMSRCKEIGYKPVSEAVMHQVEDEEKEYSLRYHSEKLAVAFGLLKTVDVAITVVKNLRICEDCHSAFKYISIVSNRQIIVRDKLRFHHFQNGSCSCMDYW